MAAPVETRAIATVNEPGPSAVTIFAEVSVVPSVGSVWGAFIENREDGKIARNFVPGSEHIIYGVTFQVDQGWESVTYELQDGSASTISLPVLAVVNGQPSLSSAQTTGRQSLFSRSSSSDSSSFATSGPRQSQDPPTGTGTPNPGDSGAPPKGKGHIGAIVGGAVGGVATLAIIIFLVWFLLRRRKRKQAQAGSAVQPNSSPPRVDDDRYQVEEYHAIPGKHHGGHQAHHGVPEVPPQNGINRADIAAHEHDPAKVHTAVMTAHELESGSGYGNGNGANEIRRVPVPVPELAGGSQGQHGHDGAAWRQELGDGGQPGGEYAAQQHQQQQTPQQQQNSSPYVEAQRILEMGWLESEEARLRQRRELLQQQQQGGG